MSYGEKKNQRAVRISWWQGFLVAIMIANTVFFGMAMMMHKKCLDTWQTGECRWVMLPRQVIPEAKTLPAKYKLLKEEAKKWQKSAK